MDSNKNLLFRLLNAKSEDEIEHVINDDPVLSDENNWLPFSDSRMNFGTINNQQQTPIAALIEKPVNSIDALLLKECRVRGIEPKSDAAPNSMQEAVEIFYEIPKGDFSEVIESKRRELGENILIIADGSLEKPNITVVDKGEGQHPSQFEKTFLALHKENKINVRFVQGMYGMGGSGVLPFCGECNYQLILSRRHPKLLENGQKDLWGFSLVRLRPHVSQDFKHTWYEYCINKKGKIFSFQGEPLLILPDGASLESGSIVKMFDYQLPPSARSNITLDLWRELNRLLYLPALPMLLFDLRFEKGHVATGKVLLGNKVRIVLDEKNKIEKDGRFTINDVDFGRFGLLNIEVTIFKQDALKTKDEFTSNKDAVFFTINGQTHGTLGRAFLKDEAGLPYLANTLLVHIDCTSVNPAERDKVFMPSRDRMRDGELTREIQDSLARELREHDGLKILNRLRQEQVWSRAPKDTKFMEDFVSDFVKDDKTLKDLLGLYGGIRDITEPGPTPVPKFEGKRFPTFFELLDKSVANNGVKQIPSNSYVRVRFKTDASNDYFDRDSEAGELIVAPPISRSKRLWNGILTMKLVPKLGARVGERELVRVELTRSYDQPLSCEFEVEYIGRIQTKINPPGPPQPPKTLSYELPKRNLIHEDKWGVIGWNRQNISDVVTKRINGVQGAPSNQKYVIAEVNINADSDVLHSFLRRRRLPEEKQEVIKNIYYTSIFLYSLVVYNDLAKLDRKDIFADVMRSIAKILLNLFFSNRLLKEFESV